MEELVRNAICQYNDYVAEAKLLGKWLEQADDPTAKTTCTILELKIAIINAWLNLLNADEKFVVRKHLIEEMEWPRVAFEYRERWKNEFARTERSLQVYQVNALAKIVAFADKHREITLRLFYDVPRTPHVID